jgi:hypothetical protein
MLFMHEFVQLLNHGLKEWPLSHQEVRELAYNVHDIRGYVSFIILATCFLAQIKQFFDHLDNESVLVFLNHATRYSAKSPTEFIKGFE